MTIAAVGLAIANDFNPRRLLAIDTAAVNFGLDVGPNEKLNVLGRADTRSAATWLEKNAGGPETVVINAYPGVDLYYHGFDSAYIDMQNQRYESYACNRGTVERWGNLPLVDSVEKLNARIAGKNRAWIVVETPRVDDLLPNSLLGRPRSHGPRSMAPSASSLLARHHHANEPWRQSAATICQSSLESGNFRPSGCQ